MRREFRLGLLSLIALSVILPFTVIRPAAAGPPIGMSLNSVDDWGPNYYFADAMKQARFWRDAATESNYNIGDTNGWPTVDATCGVWFYNGFGAEGANPMNGTYALSFNGIAASITAANGGMISNQVYNSGTNTTTATLVMTNSDLVLTFTGTKRTSSSGTNTGITNVQLMRPTTEGGSTPEPTGTLFMPQFLTDCSNFSVLRFMDYLSTVGNQSVNWSDRIPPTNWSQSSSLVALPGVSNGAAWEYAVMLCNATNKDAWINVPRFASNDYITKLADLIKYGSNGILPYTSTQSNPVYPPLNSNLHCYVEYSNENWGYTPSDLTAMGNSEIFGYPIVTSGLVSSITNGSLSSVADFANGLSGPPMEVPDNANAANPNYFRDVVFNGSTSVMTTQTPAATASDSSGGDELGMKFKSSTSGQITGLRFYKASGETGTHTGHLWKYGAPDGNQVCWLWDKNGTISQSLTFPATGAYTVSYYASAMTGDPQATVQVSIDGINVGGVVTPGYGFAQYTTASFNITTVGAHTLTFTNTYPTDTCRALLDLVTVSGPGTVTVPNNSFESPTVTDGAVPLVTGAGTFPWWAGSSWTLGGGGAGLALNNVSGSCFATLLGAVTFTNETTSGWQTQNLTSAINIAANTTYMVSVNNNATYAYTNSLQSGPLTWDGNMQMGFYRRWVERTVQMSNIFRSVFGDSAMPGTSSNPEIRPVLMMLASGGWIDNYTFTDLHYLQDYFNNQLALTAMPDGTVTTAHPPTYYFWGGGGAPYYVPSGSYDINTVWTSGEWSTTNFTNDWLADTANYYVPQWGHFISYEGGPQPPDDGTLSQQIWNDSRMEGLLTSHQTAYNQYGGDLWVYFTLAGSYRWGFTTDMYNLATPKMIGISQINASTEATGTYGTAIPGTFNASTTVPSYQAPNLASMAASVNHMDYAGYVVTNNAAAAFNIALSAGSAGTTNQADIYVDGTLAGTITIPNTGSNTTYANSSPITTPNLAVGTHGLLVKAKSGSFGLNNIQFSSGTWTIPPAPTNLAAAGTYQQVSLTWNSASGATAYNIYRGTTAGGESGTAIATGVTSTSYMNTGLVNGTTYYYKVTAVNPAGESPKSNEASAMAADNVAHIINDNGAAPVIDGNVDAVWSGVPSYSMSHLISGTGSGLSGSYQALWDTTNIYLLVTVSDSNPVSNGWSGSGLEFYIDGDNNKGTAYDGNDWQFAFFYGTTPVIQEYQNGTQGANITGIVAAQASITGGYRMEVKIPWSTIGVTASANNLAGLDMDIFNTISGAGNKKAWWETSNTDWNNPSTFGAGMLFPVSGGVPSPPTNLTATAGNTQVSLSWTASTGATSYNVYRGTVSGGESGTAIATGISAASYTNTGLTNGIIYYYTVKAVNSSGTSGASNEAGGGGNMMDDPLNDFSKIYSKSANWAIDTSNADARMEYDPARATRTTDTDETLKYHVANMTSASIRIYYYNGQGNNLKLWASSIDGSYTQLTTQEDTPVATSNGWTRVNISVTSLPANTNFLMIEVPPSGTNWTPEISEVKISYSSTTTTDLLNDWTVISSKSANWGLDTTNSGFINGDTSRATRLVDDTEYLIYKFTGITTFNAKVYTYMGPVTTAKFYSSVDNGATFQSITANYGSETTTSGGWGYYNIVPSGSLPSGMNALKVEFNAGTGNNWDPQLSQISITHG